MGYCINNPRPRSVGHRPEFYDLDEIYFWTNTIKDWKKLLINDNYKQLGERWSLVQMPEEYYWASAGYYESGKDDFGLLSYYMEVF